MTERKRLIFSNGLGNPYAMREYEDKIYALIGPFENFNTDCDFQDNLQLVVAKHNHENGHLSDQRLRKIIGRTIMDYIEPSTEKLRRAARAVFYATDATVATDLSNLMHWAADRIEELEKQVKDNQ